MGLITLAKPDDKQESGIEFEAPAQTPTPSQLQISVVHQQYQHLHGASSSADRDDFTIRGICIGVGFTLIVIGIASFVGVYMWPDEYDCRLVVLLNQSVVDDAIDRINNDSNSRFFPTPEVQLPEPKLTSKRKCKSLEHIFLVGNALFIISSCSAGFCLTLAAFERSTVTALASNPLIVLAAAFILVQAIPVYQTSIVRYLADVQQDIKAAQLKTKDIGGGASLPIEKPALTVDVQRTFTVLLCVLFMTVYLGFAFCAVALYQKLTSIHRTNNHKASGLLHQAQMQPQQQSPSFYLLQQRAPYSGVEVAQAQSSTL